MGVLKILYNLIKSDLNNNHNISLSNPMYFKKNLKINIKVINLILKVHLKIYLN